MWIYTTTGQMVKFDGNSPKKMTVTDLTSGMYVVKMQYNNVIRSQKLYKQ
ncbi:T9SS type A sorting domain-containing protein [Bacteroides salyersiae]|nr:T9SS type A sorting domain-containing protein [Bacteroides salyersiae]